MPSGIVEIAGTLTVSGTCSPEPGGMDMTAREIGANKIGRVILLENGGVNQGGQACRPEPRGMDMTVQDTGANKIGRVILLQNDGVGQRGQAAGVREIGRVFLQMLGMVLCPGKARPYFAN